MTLFRVLVAFVVLATVIAALWSLGFRVNLTASLPLGVIRQYARVEATRGDLLNMLAESPQLTPSSDVPVDLTAIQPWDPP